MSKLEPWHCNCVSIDSSDDLPSPGNLELLAVSTYVVHRLSPRAVGKGRVGKIHVFEGCATDLCIALFKSFQEGVIINHE